MDYGVRAIIPDEDLDHATELALDGRGALFLTTVPSKAWHRN
jgi:hypothetical protein